MKLQAIPFEQSGERFWVGIARAGELIQATTVDRWSPSNRQGYQREENDRRARAFGSFVNNGNPSPTAAFINLRPPATVKVLGNGQIEVPAPAFITDYQHRRRGLELTMAENPQLAKFEIPVIVTNWDRLREAEFFLIVNKTAKSVRTDLAENILLNVERARGRFRAIESLPSNLVRDIEWRPVAVELAHTLNDDKTSVWHGRIRLPNSPRTARTTVRQVSFTESLKPVLGGANGLGRKDFAGILNSYWEAVQAVWTQCFRNPAEYVLLGTTGVMVMHRLLPYILGKLVMRPKQAKPADFAKLLRLTGKPAKFWHKDGEAGRLGTSQKAFGLLAVELRDAIDDNT